VHSPNVPARLSEQCAGSEQGRAWLAALPGVLAELAERWSLRLAAPFDHADVRYAWVAPAARADGSPAVLKIALPHFEAEHELDGLELWQGDGMVRLLDADRRLHALLLERCEPGSALRELPELEQDQVIAGLLKRLWRAPPAAHPFRPLARMLAAWSDELRARNDARSDSTLLTDALQLFEQLSRPGPHDVLLTTDLHAGNVLRARREPWLAIDPKPFVGDRTYDATQHLLNCRERLRSEPDRTIRGFAELLGLDPERLRLWTFARLASEDTSYRSESDAALVRKLARGSR
jgi:streptomycin 6-kinase